METWHVQKMSECDGDQNGKEEHQTRGGGGGGGGVGGASPEAEVSDARKRFLNHQKEMAQRRGGGSGGGHVEDDGAVFVHETGNPYEEDLEASMSKGNTPTTNGKRRNKKKKKKNNGNGGRKTIFG